MLDCTPDATEYIEVVDSEELVDEMLPFEARRDDLSGIEVKEALHIERLLCETLQVSSGLPSQLSILNEAVLDFGFLGGLNEFTIDGRSASSQIFIRMG